MKRFSIVLVLVVALVGGAWAAPTAPRLSEEELRAALQDVAGEQVGTMTVDDMIKLAARLSVERQKARYVERAGRLSLMIPGAGQIMTGDTLGGSLFIAGDVATWAGALVGAYFLLPSNLQFSSLDYFNTPVKTIDDLWAAHTVVDYLPSIGVLAAGVIVKHILGHVSARLAVDEARANVADGKVTFTPDFEFLGNGFGMGMRMRF
ncbi:MAG TPA: hypothetical protein VHE79_03245 [Spirochaetia bacterium]